MSSSSSDSDSDDYEPIRKIKINIRPKDEITRAGAADINEIKASVEAWRPLGPPPHPSLSRRQNSLSSVSSISFGAGGSLHGFSQLPSNHLSHNNNNNNTINNHSIGATNINKSSSGFGSDNMRSSPSCSSLVGDFYTTRPSPLNPIAAAATLSRTSSPKVMINHSDSVPIAIAIQESIELIIRGPYNPSASEPKFDTRSLGNIKVAFPNSFAAKCISGKPSPILKLQMHSTSNITRYYASGLIKDLDLEPKVSPSLTNGSNTNGSESNSTNFFADLIDMPVSTSGEASSSSKSIEFDMDNLLNQLRRMYEQSPRSRYFNLDILRYQITPIKSIDECPLQVCAYWKVETRTVKLRVDFKQPSRAMIDSNRLRDISFVVSLADLIPSGIPVNCPSNNSSQASSNFEVNDHFLPDATTGAAVALTHKPEASWTDNIRQLCWKFDNLKSCTSSLSGIGSLFAKLDFQNYHALASTLTQDLKLPPVQIKFLAADSTLSKATMSVEAKGYRMSMLKEELRSGRYKCEPFVVP